MTSSLAEIITITLKSRQEEDVISCHGTAPLAPTLLLAPPASTPPHLVIPIPTLALALLSLLALEPQHSTYTLPNNIVLGQEIEEDLTYFDM